MLLLATPLLAMEPQPVGSRRCKGLHNAMFMYMYIYIYIYIYIYTNCIHQLSRENDDT